MPRIPEIPEVPEIPEIPEMPEISDVPKIPEIPEDPGLPRRPEMRFSTISGRFRGRFSSFFQVSSHERLDSHRTGPNLSFCWQERYFEGFADLTKRPKIDKPWRRIAPPSLRERAAREKLDFFASGRDLASILIASARSRAVPGGLYCVPGRPWGLSGRSWSVPDTLKDAPKMLPRRLRDALGCHGAFREGPGSD